jgi:uncharacterized membrane protein YoaT (DUF817 family)
MSQINLKKLLVGISALILSIITVLVWIFKSKNTRLPAIIMTLLSICFWIWYANIPSFQSEKTFDKFNQTFRSVNKGDVQ